MTTQKALISALHAAMPAATQTDIAATVGVSLARWNNYERGKRHMDDDAIIGACAALKYSAKDTRKALAAHRVDTAHTPREVAFWRQLGIAAAVALAAILPHQQATAEGLTDAPTRHYAKSLIGSLCARGFFLVRQKWASIKLRALFRNGDRQREQPSPMLAA